MNDSKEMKRLNRDLIISTSGDSMPDFIPCQRGF